MPANTFQVTAPTFARPQMFRFLSVEFFLIKTDRHVTKLLSVSVKLFATTPAFFKIVNTHYARIIYDKDLKNHQSLPIHFYGNVY